MDKPTGGTLEKLGRRLNSVKVVVDLFGHELDVNKADRNITLERERLDAIVTTLEMYIEDCEALMRGAGSDDRRVIEASRPAGATTRVP
jgi:hypothetical protein